jgi:hypothetical protein
MKPLTILVFLSLLLPLSVSALLTITITETFTNVINRDTTVSGEINFSDFGSSSITGSYNSGIRPNEALIAIGGAFGNAGSSNRTFDGIIGPSSIGTSNFFSSWFFIDTDYSFRFSGDDGLLSIGSSYTSGSDFNGFLRQRDISIEPSLTPGSYTWQHVSNPAVDVIQLTIVPEPSNFAFLASLLVTGIVLVRRKRRYTEHS